MIANREAVKKANDILNAEEDVRRCLKARVCPACAQGLKNTRAIRGGLTLECIGCHETYRVNDYKE